MKKKSLFAGVVCVAGVCAANAYYAFDKSQITENLEKAPLKLNDAAVPVNYVVRENSAYALEFPLNKVEGVSYNNIRAVFHVYSNENTNGRVYGSASAPGDVESGNNDWVYRIYSRPALFNGMDPYLEPDYTSGNIQGVVSNSENGPVVTLAQSAISTALGEVFKPSYVLSAYLLLDTLVYKVDGVERPALSYYDNYFSPKYDKSTHELKGGYHGTRALYQFLFHRPLPEKLDPVAEMFISKVESRDTSVTYNNGEFFKDVSAGGAGGVITSLDTVVNLNFDFQTDATYQIYDITLLGYSSEDENEVPTEVHVGPVNANCSSSRRCRASVNIRDAIDPHFRRFKIHAKVTQPSITYLDEGVAENTVEYDLGQEIKVGEHALVIKPMQPRAVINGEEHILQFVEGIGNVYLDTLPDDPSASMAYNITDERTLIVGFTPQKKVAIRAHNKSRSGYKFNGWYNSKGERVSEDVLLTFENGIGYQDTVLTPVYLHYAFSMDVALEGKTFNEGEYKNIEKSVLNAKFLVGAEQNIGINVNAVADGEVLFSLEMQRAESETWETYVNGKNDNSVAHFNCSYNKCLDGKKISVGEINALNSQFTLKNGAKGAVTTNLLYENGTPIHKYRVCATYVDNDGNKKTFIDLEGNELSEDTICREVVVDPVVKTEYYYVKGGSDELLKTEYVEQGLNHVPPVPPEGFLHESGDKVKYGYSWTDITDADDNKVVSVDGAAFKVDDHSKYRLGEVTSYRVAFLDFDDEPFKINGVQHEDAVQWVVLGGVAKNPTDPTHDDNENFQFAGWNKDLPTSIVSPEELNAKYKAKTVFVIDGKETVAWTPVGETATMPKAEKEGYRFAGWLKNGSSDYKDGYTVTDYTRFVAMFVRRVTVTFMQTGDDDVPVAQSTYDEGAYIIPPKEDLVNVPEDGVGCKNSFVGWKKQLEDAASEPVYYKLGDTADENVVYLPAFDCNPETYDVKFVVNGAQLGETAHVAYNNVVFAPVEEPKMKGFVFEGWIKNDETEAKKAANFTITENTTFTAKFTANVYTITFEDVNGKIDCEECKNVFAGTEIKTPSVGKIALPEESDQYRYEFAGWNPAIADGETVTGDQHYVALYKAILKSYEVKFLADGKQIGETQVVAYEGSAVAPTAPQKDGYVFFKWDTEDYKNVLGDLEVNAIYLSGGHEGVFSIVFKQYGQDKPNLSEKPYVAGEEIVAPADADVDVPADNESCKYSFKGWSPTYKAGDLALSAQTYEPVVECEPVTYDVVFIVDGTQFGETVHATYEQVLTPANAPEKKGFTFDGWLKNNQTVVTGDFKIVAPTTYTAKYTAGKFTVTFEDVKGKIDFSNGKQIAGTEIVTPSVDEIALPEESAQYSYVFAGWYPAIAEGETVTGDQNYTAVYKTVMKYYTVMFFADEKQIGETKTVAYGATVEAPAAPSKEGYTFLKWDTDKYTKVEGNVSAKAVYEKIVEETSSSSEEKSSSSSAEDKLASSSSEEKSSSSSADKPASSSSEATSSSSSADKPASSSSEEMSSSSSEAKPASSSSRNPEAIVAGFEAPKFQAVVYGRELSIFGATVGKKLAIFDLQGSVIAVGRVDAANFSVTLPRSGMYVVRVGNQVQKVNVR